MGCIRLDILEKSFVPMKVVYSSSDVEQNNVQRFLSLDPKGNDGESPYEWLGDNPIFFMDILGDTVVDKFDNNVSISRDKNGNLQYGFSEKYNKRQKRRAEKYFMKHTAPVLEAMNKSEEGYKDIQTLNSISTYVTLTHSNGSNLHANSHVTPGEIQNNGYYDVATIKPYFGNYSTESGDFGEWLGATMTVEVGHLGKEQIALEEQGYSSNPKSSTFKYVYTPLLNKATAFRIKYRIEHNQIITLRIFKALDKYHIDYDKFNRQVRDQLDKSH